MKVHKDIENLPHFGMQWSPSAHLMACIWATGRSLNNLKAEASAINGETVIITFHPHPRKVISSTILGIRLINTLDEKLELLEQLGIDHLVVVPFTDAFANQPAEDYIKNFLIEKFHPHTIIIGYDHRFGKERKGDYLLLERIGCRI